MGNNCAAFAIALVLLAAAPGPTASREILNPLLLQQSRGTWILLPRTGAVQPERIHRHAGGAIDPATSILYFFGSDTHGDQWNNEVWSYDPVSMTWAQSYPEDAPEAYRYLEGRKTTTSGHPWAMHSFAMNAWAATSGRLVMGAWQMHYGPESLPHLELPPDAPESWWQYDPSRRAWTPVPRGPDLGLGHICYVPSLGRIIGFSGENVPVTLYHPEKQTFQEFGGFRGKSPDGYTLRSAYDSRRERVLLISWDRGPNVWALDLKGKRWTNLQVKNRPPADVYGSWDYDSSADALVGLWPDDPGGGFENESGKSRTFLVDLARGLYREVITEPAPPYYGMSFKVFYDRRHDVTLAVVGDEVWSFKAPSLAAGRPF